MVSLKVIYFPMGQPKLKNSIHFYVASKDAEYRLIITGRYLAKIGFVH
jgi:hypothetical protein